MNKKGMELATSTIIMVILGLIVLAILVVVFQKQISNGSRSYTDISKQATLSQDSCTIVLGRSCAKNCGPNTRRVEATGCSADVPICCESL